MVSKKAIGEFLAQKTLAVVGLVILTPPQETLGVVEEAAAAGIRHIWIQQGAESPEAIAYGEEKGLNLIHHECLLMFAEPAAFPHRVHRTIWKWIGKLPK